MTDLNRVETDAALQNSPLWFGEWALPTQFNATDEFLFQWADAQKRAYSVGAGWIVSIWLVVGFFSVLRLIWYVSLQFWSFKIEESDLAGDTARQW